MLRDCDISVSGDGPYHDDDTSSRADVSWDVNEDDGGGYASASGRCRSIDRDRDRPVT
jgi:hypothetical protein